MDKQNSGKEDQEKREDSGKVRTGEWTLAEEDYVRVLVEEFQAGFLALPKNTSLRQFIAKMLGCRPKRISKHYEEFNYSSGKKFYLKNPFKLIPEEAMQRRGKLVEAERKFRKSVLVASRRTMMRFAGSSEDWRDEIKDEELQSASLFDEHLVSTSSDEETQPAGVKTTPERLGTKMAAPGPQGRPMVSTAASSSSKTLSDQIAAHSSEAGPASSFVSAQLLTKELQRLQTPSDPRQPSSAQLSGFHSSQSPLQVIQKPPVSVETQDQSRPEAAKFVSSLLLQLQQPEAQPQQTQQIPRPASLQPTHRPWQQESASNILNIASVPSGLARSPSKTSFGLSGQLQAVQSTQAVSPSERANSGLVTQILREIQRVHIPTDSDVKGVMLGSRLQVQQNSPSSNRLFQTQSQRLPVLESNHLSQQSQLSHAAASLPLASDSLIQIAEAATASEVAAALEQAIEAKLAQQSSLQAPQQLCCARSLGVLNTNQAFQLLKLLLDDEALKRQLLVQVQGKETTEHALVQKAVALSSKENGMVGERRAPGVGLNPNMQPQQQQQTRGGNQQPSGTETPSTPVNAQAILPMLKVLLEEKQKEEAEVLEKQQQEQQKRLQRHQQQELLLPLLSLGQQVQGGRFALVSGHAGVRQRVVPGVQQQPSLAAFKPLSVAPAPLDNGLSFLLQNISQGVGSVTPSNREPPVSSGSGGCMAAHAQPTGANSSTSQGFSTAGAAFQGSEEARSGYADSDDDRKPPAEKRQRR